MAQAIPISTYLICNVQQAPVVPMHRFNLFLAASPDGRLRSGEGGAHDAY